jgi:hypothetical protein
MSDLLIKKTEGQLLDAFVGALRDFLGCDRWEERESVNYVEARYFRCSVLGLEVTVAIADSAEFKDYDFWLYFEPDASCRGSSMVWPIASLGSFLFTDTRLFGHLTSDV